MSLRRDPAKQRDWQQRSRPLAKGAPPKRQTPMPKVNAERRTRTRDVQFGPQADLCRRLPCCCHHPELYGPEFLALEHYSERRVSDPHHSPTVGAGGKDGDTAPVCRETHMRLDSPGHSEASVEAEYGISFRDVAALIRRNIRGNVK